jgi:hypothetical protein
VQLAGAQGPHADDVQPLGRKRGQELGTRGGRVLAADGGGEEAWGRQPAQGERERPRAGGIEPLQVVDEERDGGQVLEHSEDAEAEGARVRGRVAGVLEHERDAQRARLGPRKRAEITADGLEEVAEAGEGQVRLRLRRAAGEDAQPRLGGKDAGGLPQRRLADARRALEHEPGGAVARGAARRPQRLELPRPAHELPRAHHTGIRTTRAAKRVDSRTFAVRGRPVAFPSTRDPPHRPWISPLTLRARSTT